MATMPVKKGFFVTSPFGQRRSGMHYGTDFGLEGGSGGQPIYAIRAGQVTAAGPASGFGRWITIDHPTSAGGGLSVYGHVIPEVKIFDQVVEGQRIGRIDPSSATNGGVAPHLHLEFHRRVWSPPGPDRLDPMATVLAGAGWPGEAPSQSDTKPETQQVSTLIGIDVSEFQDGMILQDSAVDFCIIRTNYGSAHEDLTAPSHAADWRRTGKPHSYYTWLRPSSRQSIAAQADLAKKVWEKCGADSGMWIDVEEPGVTRADVVAMRDALRARGIHVIGVYSRANFWEALPGGEPKAGEGGGAIWVSHYGSQPSGPIRDIYPGDNSSIWLYPLGDRRPDLWQWTDRARVRGWPHGVDANAYKGTENSLRALFTGKNTSDQEKLDMSAVQEIKDYIDARLTGPVGTDVKDIRQQITGGRDSIPGDLKASYPGWDLGQLVRAAREKEFTGLTMMEILAVNIAGNDDDFRAARVAAGTEEAGNAE